MLKSFHPLHPYCAQKNKNKSELSGGLQDFTDLQCECFSLLESVKT